VIGGVQNCGPVVWLLVMLLMLCMVIIALLLDRPPEQMDEAVTECEKRLP
jgi:hypothetical protein